SALRGRKSALRGTFPAVRGRKSAKPTWLLRGRNPAKRGRKSASSGGGIQRVCPPKGEATIHFTPPVGFATLYAHERFGLLTTSSASAAGAEADGRHLA